MKNELTELETAILNSAFLTGERDYKKLYLLVYPGADKLQSSFQSTVSKWKHSALVEKYMDSLAEKYSVSIKGNEQRETGTAGNSSPQKGLQIDFANRDQFIKFLNESLNTITDDKTRTDYLKMLSDLLRFKESTPDSQNDIQRFYVGVNCCNCAIYKDSLK